MFIFSLILLIGFAIFMIFFTVLNIWGVDHKNRYDR